MTQSVSASPYNPQMKSTLSFADVPAPPTMRVVRANGSNQSAVTTA